MTKAVGNGWAPWSMILALVACMESARAQTAPPGKSDATALTQDSTKDAKPRDSAIEAAPPGEPKKATDDREKQQPTLAEILAQVAERHPDVLVAEARVREAEALLLQARLAVAQKTAASYHLRKEAEARLSESEKLAAKRIISADEFSMAKAKFAMTEAESPYSFLEMPGAEQFNLQRQANGRLLRLPVSRAAIDPSKFPRGPAVETVKRELSRPLTLEFSETPLADVVSFVNLAGVTVLLDRERGVEPDQPMSLALTEAPLGSALLAIEDLYRPLRFVVRDYGLLITTEAAIGEDTVTLRDFMNTVNRDSSTTPKAAENIKR